MGAIKESIEKTKPIKSVFELGIGKGDFMESLINCFDEETEFVGVDKVIKELKRVVKPIRQMT